MPKTVTEVLEMGKNVKMVDLRFTDLPGTWQHFTIPAHRPFLEDLAAGLHALTAVATDNGSLSTTSAVVNLSVSAATITLPRPGSLASGSRPRAAVGVAAFGTLTPEQPPSSVAIASSADRGFAASAAIERISGKA